MRTATTATATRARGAQAYWRMSPGDQCTNYAAFVESTVYHVAAPSYLLGNGGQWAYLAAAHGVLVNHTPSVGAVAEWDGGTFGMGSLGHVGVVEAVGPQDSYIVISQQHMGGLNGYNWTLIKAHQASQRMAGMAEPLHPFPDPAPGRGRLLQPAHRDLRLA